MFSANIPDGIRAPLRIAITNTWEPRRLRTPRFTNAWVAFEDEVQQHVHVLLDNNCENVVVFRTQGMSARIREELHVGEREINFSKVCAKSGSGREDSDEFGVDDINDVIHDDD